MKTYSVTVRTPEGLQVVDIAAISEKKAYWIDPLAQYLPDDMPVVPFDMVPNGIYTVRNVKDKIKEYGREDI